MSISEQAQAILESTSNGANLYPADLKLVQSVISGSISEAAEIAIYELYDTVVRNNSYPRWFHGIQFLTQDHEGYVYWRGQHVEHYSFKDEIAEKQAAERLATDCKSLESKHFKVTSRTVLCKAALEAPVDTLWKEAIYKFYAFFKLDDKVLGIFYHGGAEYTEDKPVSLSNCSSLGIEVNEGKLVVTPFKESFIAYREATSKGFTPLPADPSYSELVSYLEQMQVPPAMLHGLIS